MFANLLSFFNIPFVFKISYVYLIITITDSFNIYSSNGIFFARSVCKNFLFYKNFYRHVCQSLHNQTLNHAVENSLTQITHSMSSKWLKGLWSKTKALLTNSKPHLRFNNLVNRFVVICIKQTDQRFLACESSIPNTFWIFTSL